MTANGHKVSLGVTKVFQKSIGVVVMQLCEYTKYHAMDTSKV